jgi:hypothetical protein
MDDVSYTDEVEIYWRALRLPNYEGRRKYSLMVDGYEIDRFSNRRVAEGVVDFLKEHPGFANAILHERDRMAEMLRAEYGEPPDNVPADWAS